MKTSELTGRALDWAVAVAVGAGPIMRHDHLRAKAARNNRPQEELAWHLSTENNNPITVDEDGVTKIIPYYHLDWAVVGPIIEREEINLGTVTDGPDKWQANYDVGMSDTYECGPTPLIAAMRCFVASRIGPEIQIPVELT